MKHVAFMKSREVVYNIPIPVVKPIPTVIKQFLYCHVFVSECVPGCETV